jgi:hypothetical protein
MKKMKNPLIIILTLLLLSCGFKPINQKDNNLINLKNINVVGDQRIAYLIKNNILLISNDNSRNEYNADITIIKNKSAKIKDSTGKIKRYSLSLSADLKLTNLSDKTELQKSFTRSSDYDVRSIHSDTINNENNVIKNIIQQLTDDITNFIILSVRLK